MKVVDLKCNQGGGFEGKWELKVKKTRVCGHLTTYRAIAVPFLVASQPYNNVAPSISVIFDRAIL